jgi:hypothetical protein
MLADHPELNGTTLLADAVVAVDTFYRHIVDHVGEEGIRIEHSD